MVETIGELMEEVAKLDDTRILEIIRSLGFLSKHLKEDQIASLFEIVNTTYNWKKLGYIGKGGQ